MHMIRTVPSHWLTMMSLRLSQGRLSAAGLSFLLDESDTVLAYENKGKNNEQRAPGHDPLMSALDQLNHVQQLEIIHGTPLCTSTSSTTTSYIGQPVLHVPCV